MLRSNPRRRSVFNRMENQHRAGGEKSTEKLARLWENALKMNGIFTKIAFFDEA